ncbi:hypothetical protein AB0L85_31055 [Streptomyces sp. NPDC052051]|uniref:hypothetical protein n=1 Tax=Streptomyces sp. NPDC052051 TaxID=3154649 RepID=UPI003431C2D8
MPLFTCAYEKSQTRPSAWPFSRRVPFWAALRVRLPLMPLTSRRAERGRLLEGLPAADAALTTAVEELVDNVRRFDPILLIEVARQRFLPFGPQGVAPSSAEANTAHLELLTLVAHAIQHQTRASLPAGAGVQEMSRYIAGAAAELGKILHLAQLRSFAATDPADQLALVSVLIRSAEVWMRNSSYPEMVTTTNLALLDGDPSVRTALNTYLGFDAHDALAVLDACNDLQLDALDERLRTMEDAVTGAMAAAQKGQHDDEVKEFARFSLLSMFDPGADQATVSIGDIAARTGIPAARVTAVAEQFRLDLGAATAADVIDAFTTGTNPLRTRPLLVTGNGRLMLPHPTLHVFAVRENLEEYLKTLAPVWSQYAKHRRELLESRTRHALGRVFPSAHFRDAFEYYVPANDDEAVPQIRHGLGRVDRDAAGARARRSPSAVPAFGVVLPDAPASRRRAGRGTAGTRPAGGARGVRRYAGQRAACGHRR